MEEELGKTQKWEQRHNLTTMEKLDLARALKLVGLLSAIAVSCIVMYVASCTNFGQFQLLTMPFFYQYHLINNGSSSSSWDLLDEPVHDEYYELKKVLKEASTEDRTVILTTLNEAWAEPNSIFDMFLESFKTGNNTARLLNHLLVIAVDEKAYSKCQATLSHCYYLKGNKSSEMAHEARYMTPIYLEIVWQKLALLQTILSLGHNFVFTDNDIMWFRDPFPHFYPDIDFQTSCDYFNEKPFDMDNVANNGFTFVRSNNRTVEFYKFWVSSRWRYPDLHEQDVFNMIKHDPIVKKIGLKIRFLDTDYFGGFCTPSRDFNKVCTMHANCCIGLERKMPDLNTTLEDWKRFVSLASNLTASQQSSWRVPNKCL